MAMNPPPAPELAVRAAGALLDAAALTLTEAGLPAPRHRGMGSWWPLCSHSFATVNELAYLPSGFEDHDRAGGVSVATVHYTVLELTVGRVRPALTDGCTWGEYMGDPVRCGDPIPTPPDDSECGAIDDCDSAYGSVSAAWAAASVDRHALIRRLVPVWMAKLKECGMGRACTSIELASAEPFEEGRFIGTRLAWSAQLA